MEQPIGIIELYQHNEVLIHYCDLLLSGDHQLSVFCNEAVYDDLPKKLKKSRISWFIRNSDTNINKYIKKNEAAIRECQFLLITTVSSHYKSFTELASWTRSVLMIHSAHTWLKPYSYVHLRKGHWVFDGLRLLRSILKREIPLRRKLLETVNYVALPNQSILNYVKSNFAPPKNVKFVSIPFGSYQGRPKMPIGKDLTTFTITGSIGDDVRDYSSVLEALSLLSLGEKCKIKLVLLGKPKRKIGQDIIKKFQAIALPSIEIITFSSYISQDDYDNYLIETDYLILPLKKYTQFRQFREYTCYSKLSGSINDLVRFGISAIASRYCTIDEKVDAAISYYDDPKGLANLIMEYASKEKKIWSKEKAEFVFSKHLKKNLYDQFFKLVEE